jgi:trk system potassium uptake protein TrkH
VELFGRTVPRSTVRRSVALVTLSALLLTVTTIAITAAEPDKAFEKLLFEQVSAFGTVGLSAGVTAALSVPGKLLIVLLMFAGRVGPMTLMFSLIGEGRPAHYKFPASHIMVG